MEIKKLVKRGDVLFSDRQSVLSLWQAIALNFYPERAFFTATPDQGDEFADHLQTSYPVLVQRDLSNQVGGMLRRGEWFDIKVKGTEVGEHQARRWLQAATKKQYELMNHRGSGFTRATKEGDKDFTAFGQCAISIEWVPGHGILYRCWHLKDMAWSEDFTGQVTEFHRNWEAPLHMIEQKFGKKNMHDKALKVMAKNSFEKLKCRHVVMRSEDYGDDSIKEPYVSIYLDVAHEHIMETQGVYHPIYALPRWQTASGSQYGHSPATIVGIADARLIQDMYRVLLSASEKAVDPPMVAVKEAVRGDVRWHAGGITWVDQGYEGTARDAISPMSIDKNGIPIGIEMAEQAQLMLGEIFYKNKLTLPVTGDMTAYEASQRVQDYIRQALPIFEPMETEYNGALCDMTFDVMMRAGEFGSPSEFPQSLRGADVEFAFKSPIRDAEGKEKGARFNEAMGMLGASVQLDPGVSAEIDLGVSMRDAMRGMGIPETWLRDEKQVAAVKEQLAQQMAAQQQQAQPQPQ